MSTFDSREMAKIAIGKKLCKEYRTNDEGAENFVVYLNDGDEFQIQLFNPTKYVVGAKIRFNNDDRNYQSENSYIVLRPGERVWLERYIDCQDKFVFNTYEVSNSRQVLEAIKDNGDITIEFYYESQTRCKSKSPQVWYTSTDVLSPSYYYLGNNVTAYTQSSGDVRTNISNTLFSSCSTVTDTNVPTSLSITGTSASTSTVMPDFGSYTTASDTVNMSATVNVGNKIETGRIEHGGHSDQDFKHAYYEFDSWPFTVKNFKILPVSRKQYSESDLRKSYCTNCGRKLSPKFKFCPVCGTKV